MAFTELKTESIRENIRAEAFRRRESLLGSKLDSDRLLREQLEELTGRLMESESDRAARLVRLQESEADRAARFDQITELTRLLKESEADRAARLDVIHNLEKDNARLNALLNEQNQQLYDFERRWGRLGYNALKRIAARLGFKKKTR